MTIKDKHCRNTLSDSAKAAKNEAKKTQAEKTDRGLNKDQRFKERWSQLNSDVHSALNYWNDITKKYDGKVSKDQEQLQEIKCLLKELQKKIKVFND